MKAAIIISSVKNEKIKRLVRLRDKKGRETERCSIIEGYRLLSRAIENHIKINELYYCPQLFLGTNEFNLIAKAEKTGAEIYQVTANVFAKFAYRDRPEGLAAVIPIKEHSLSSLKIRDDSTFLVLESIEKPGNLGSMLRSADAAAADAVLICEKRTDIYNPNVITASTGTLFTVPIGESSKDDVFNWLINNKVKIIIASPHASKIFTEVNMSGRIAIVIGSEQCGLDEFWLQRADEKLVIPMLGMADSLNAATAATILLYEAARQKKWRKIPNNNL